MKYKYLNKNLKCLDHFSELSGLYYNEDKNRVTLIGDNLTIKGRITVAKCMIMSQFTHMGNIIYPPRIKWNQRYI